MVSACLSQGRCLGGCKLQLLGRGIPLPSEQADARQSIKGKAYSLRMPRVGFPFIHLR
jgi:hypothetical protein